MDKKLENILNLSLDQVMSDRFGRYSKYIIQDRALPDARDGMKPVQRRILYSMQDLGLFWDKPFKKSARVVGDVIGKYHPHGDSSIYEALVRMTQDWKMNIPLIQMHGNNGSIDDDPAAAMRYTEARLAKVTDYMLDNLKKDTVLFAPNFDDSEKEPTVLPALFPNLLVNGAKGIAAGYATEMPPHNLGEVLDAIITRIKSPNCRLDTLLQCIQGPDFPTGGIIQGKDGIYEAFERGRGRIVIRSKYEISDLKTKPSITVTEIPYGVVKSKLVRDIDEIRFNNKIDGIKDVRDQTDRTGISIYIELAPNTDPNAVLNYLLSKTELQVYYSYNNVAIKDKVPTQMGLIELIDAYLKHQREVQTRALKFDLAKDERRMEIVEGLIKVALIAEEVIDAIRNADGSKQGVISTLISKFKFTELQATAIAELRLYRLSKTDQSIYLQEREELKERIAKVKQILSSDEELDKYLVELLRELKKNFAVPRKSVIEDAVETISIDMDALIKHEDVWVGVSRDGYIKRFSNRANEANDIKEYALKAGDSLVYYDFINTADKLLVFTNKGNYFFIPTHKLAEVKFKDFGKHVNDFAAIPVEEKIVDVIAVSDFSLDAYITLASREGKIKRTKVSEFEVSRFTKTYTAMNLTDKDEIVGARLSNGFKQVILVSTQGRAVKYSETQVPVSGARSAGVRAMALPGDHFITAFTLAGKDDIIGLVSKRGGAKRMKVSAISPMARTTQGKQLFREIKGNPHMAIDMSVVQPSDKAIFSTEKLNIVEFKDVDITSTEEGFSLVGPAQTIDAKIFVFAKAFKGNPLLEKPADLSEEEQFAKAEEAINAIDQISLDDLLKDL